MADRSVDDWQDEWGTSRAWFGQDGASSATAGNSVFKYDPIARTLDVLIPTGIAVQHGISVRKSAAGGWIRFEGVRFKYLGDELKERILTRVPTRFDLVPTFKDGVLTRLDVRASWSRIPAKMPLLAYLQEHASVGVDLNEGHLDAHLLDTTGNPVGPSKLILFDQTGSSPHRDGQLRSAISELLKYTLEAGASSIVIEDLGFEDPTLREKKHPKSFNKTIAGFPTTQFKERIIRMADRKDLSVVAVDAHHTTKRGGPAWAMVLNGGRKKPTKKTPKTSKPASKPADEAAAKAETGKALNEAGKDSSKASSPKKSGRIKATKHSGAAVAIGRRALGLRIACSGPATHQMDGSQSVKTVDGTLTDCNLTASTELEAGTQVGKVRRRADARTGGRRSRAGSGDNGFGPKPPGSG
jgi:hypothetical protein